MQNKINLVDIILPNYNKGKFLKETIDSIIYLSFKNFKLYIIDDFSTKISRRKWVFSNCDKTSNCSSGAIKNQNNNTKKLRFKSAKEFHFSIKRV